MYGSWADAASRAAGCTATRSKTRCIRGCVHPRNLFCSNGGTRLHDSAYQKQDLIPEQLPASIVDRLEMIDVHEREPAGLRTAAICQTALWLAQFVEPGFKG